MCGPPKIFSCIAKIKIMRPEFVVAIPSYDRPKELRKKTLAMLLENGIPPAVTTVFVADAAQRTLYAAEIGPEYKIVVGKKGMVNIRNFITQYYPAKTRILNIDDDVSRIIKGEPTGMTARPVRNLVALANEGFRLCKANGFALWGLHPSTNRRSLKSANTVTTDFKYIVGALYGVINDRSLKVSIDHAEDYERSIQYYIKYGGMVRFNRYSALTAFYAKGGLEAAGRTVAKEDADKKALVRRYPRYATTYVRPNGRTEIRLKDENAPPRSRSRRKSSRSK